MLKRIVFAGTAALAGVLILVLLSVNLLVERNKDFLIGRAEQTFGRKISVGQIQITFWPFGARLQKFALGDDPAFSAEDFVRTKELRLELRLLPLFIGEFRPSRMMLESPIIAIVRDASGRYNFATRDRSEKIARDGADRGPKHPTEPMINHFLLAPALDIADGTLRFRDLAGGELVVSHIKFKAGDFEQDQPFEIELEAAVNVSEPNLKLKSRIGPIAGIRDFRDIPLDGAINATDLNLGKVNKALPRLRKALPRALRFDGIYTIKELKFKGTLNNLSLKGSVSGTDASFRFE
jgi:uncharacterized protein involved in outer membrane biogenesis